MPYLFIVVSFFLLPRRYTKMAVTSIICMMMKIMTAATIPMMSSRLILELSSGDWVDGSIVRHISN